MELAKVLHLSIDRIGQLEEENRLLRVKLEEVERRVGSSAKPPSPDRIDELEQENLALKAEIRLLRQKLEESRKQSHRSATPFSKGQRKRNPKRPGRKPGQGTFQRKRAPVPRPQDQVNRKEARLDSNLCPDCGTELEMQDPEDASVVDLPRMIGRIIDLFRVEVGHCPQCNRTVRGTHPDLARDQHGATAHRVGPRAYAWAYALFYGLGLPLRKVAKVFNEFVSVPLCRGGLLSGGGRNAWRALAR